MQLILLFSKKNDAGKMQEMKLRMQFSTVGLYVVILSTAVVV